MTQSTTVAAVAFADVLFPSAIPKAPVTPLMISGTQACPSSEIIIAALPPAIKGLRLPQFDWHSSLRRQKYGWRNAPDIGPASHTNDSKDLLIPRLVKYSLKVVRKSIQLLKISDELTEPCPN